ncbi:hypothetical protein WMY93_025434 [Mugilogobius chulae]|uniref:Uncharacterized protein n=1 Tax=Mugilogobius chulae TaxID=88201 RepID=A0AAW0NEL5_9GOBI
MTSLEHENVIDLSSGDSQKAGMKPLSFIRQVLAGCVYPSLLDDQTLLWISSSELRHSSMPVKNVVWVPIQTPQAWTMFDKVLQTLLRNEMECIVQPGMFLSPEDHREL